MEDKKLTDAQKQRWADEFNTRLPQILKCDPVVPITLRDKQYSMEMDNKAVKYLYLNTKVNLLSRFTVADLYTPDNFSHYLFAVLHRHHPELTISDIDELIDFRKFMYIRDQAMKCIELFLPDMSDIEKEFDKEQSSDPH